MNHAKPITNAALPERGPCTRQQVAEFFGVSQMTVVRWEANGQLPPARKVGRAARHEAADIWNIWKGDEVSA